jgi:hypothetical protein
MVRLGRNSPSRKGKPPDDRPTLREKDRRRTTSRTPKPPRLRTNSRTNPYTKNIHSTKASNALQRITEWTRGTYDTENSTGCRASRSCARTTGTPDVMPGFQQLLVAPKHGRCVARTPVHTTYGTKDNDECSQDDPLLGTKLCTNDNRHQEKDVKSRTGSTA